MLTPFSRQKLFSELVSDRTASGARSDLDVYWSDDVDTLLNNQRTNLRSETAAISGGLDARITSVSGSLYAQTVAASASLYAYTTAASASLYAQTVAASASLYAYTTAVSASVYSASVHKTGTESVSGVKTFHNYINIISTVGTTAVSGAAALIQPVGYFLVQLNGTVVKVPYYS